MPQPNEPQATSRTDAAAASMSAQTGTTTPGALPTTLQLIAEVEATKLLVAQGFCSTDEGRLRLQAIRVEIGLVQHAGNGAAINSEPGAAITALAKECEGRPEMLRAVLPMLPPAQQAELLKRLEGSKAR